MIEEIASRPGAGEQIAYPLVAPSSPASTRLSINETTTYHWGFQDDVLGYCEAGIEAIGIWRSKLVQYGEEKGIELVEEMGLSVSSLSWAGGFTGSNGCSFEEAVDDARDAIALAGNLKTNCLSLVSGTRAGHTTRHARRLVAQAIRALAEDAAKRNVSLALQPMSPLVGQQFSFVNSLDETLEIIGMSGVEQARIAFDVYHLFREPRLIERIPEIAPLVAIVQLNDFRDPPRSEIDRCLPGDGEIPLREITEAFLAAEYAGHFEIGVWSEEVWNSDYVQVLRSCRERFDRLIAG
ncbi:MAG: sugar phosphate isomerase/epimerase family protein [Planctomycetaceae bacterium]